MEGRRASTSCQQGESPCSISLLYGGSDSKQTQRAGSAGSYEYGGPEGGQATSKEGCGNKKDEDAGSRCSLSS